MKKLIAILLFITLLASCSLEEGKVISTEPSADATAPVGDIVPDVTAEPAMPNAQLEKTVLTVDGDAVSLAELRYQVASLISAYEYYGDGEVDWSEEIEGVPAGEFFVSEAIETCKLFRAVERYAADNGYALTDDELAQIDAEIATYVAELGGEESYRATLEQAGMTESLYRYLIVVPQLYYKIYDGIYGEGGEREITEATVESYFEQNYLTTRHILKYALDDDGSYLSDEDTAAVRAEADDLLARLDAGENFVELASDNSDDDVLYGEKITFELSTMPEPYVEAAQALAEGEYSGVIDIDGAFVILRREPLDTDYLEEHYAAVAEEYGLGMFRVILDEVKAGLEATETADYALVDIEEIYDSFFGEQ